MKINEGIVLFAALMFLTACPGKGGGGGSAAPAVDPVISKFVQDYNSGVGFSATEADSSNPLVMRADGTIQYYNEVNDYCRIRWNGKINKVVERNRMYAVTYTYDYKNFINEGEYCNARHQPYYCAQRLQECRSYMFRVNRYGSSERTEIVRQGRGLEYISLRP